MDPLEKPTSSCGNSRYIASIWFENGWWYRKPDFSLVNLTVLMRRLHYNLAECSKALGLHRRTFERLVNSSLGLTPGIWLRQERAVMSRYRLREGCSIKELAFELGFAHPGEFAAEFKRWHGVNPTKFQQITASKSLYLDE